MDLGNDPDGELDGYDGPSDRICGEREPGRVDSPAHAEINLKIAAIFAYARNDREGEREALDAQALINAKLFGTEMATEMASQLAAIAP
jgi:hypothetical protein